MNVFVRNIPVDSTEKQVTAFFQRPLKECGIDLFTISKYKSKPNAVITIHPIEKGQVFLSHYGISPGGGRPARKLMWADKPVYCSHDSHRVPSEYAIKSLIHEGNRAKTRQHEKPALQKKITRFDVSRLQCGTWDYHHEQPAFSQHYANQQQGSITFGRHEAIVLLGSQVGAQTRLYIRYADCRSITLESPSAVIFDLYFPPKIYGLTQEQLLLEKVQGLSLSSPPNSRPKTKKNRLSFIDPSHEKIVGVCLVYRVGLHYQRALSAIASLLRHNARARSVTQMPCMVLTPFEPIMRSYMRLTFELTDTARFGGRPFGLRWQVEALARNALLHPSRVMELLPKIGALCDTHGLDAMRFALQRFARDMRVPGPETEAADCSRQAYEELLDDIIATYDADAHDNVYEVTKRHNHIVLVHKIVVTPTRIKLIGPDPEPTNRVLRKHAQHSDHFIRVVFQDEDGSNVRYDPLSNQKDIYHVRFKSQLDASILVAGRGFSFLGFSHSSLRNQSCWFMAPIVVNGVLNFAPQIIKGLGDFSKIRSPAKCAARIGQNFTDTNATVDLRPEMVGELPIIERNGRDFSDGVGTISYQLLRRVWRVYGLKRLLKPTALQIRFQGAKGMVALDTRLKGDRLMLRSNMKKFETEATWNLEICGAGFQPLPMVLNRQFIKIFEDLGVHESVFLDLQTSAVENLRRTIEEPIDTPLFLEQEETFRATRMPYLIRLLNEVGLDYRRDGFLFGVVEMAVLAKLRDIKYRGRIPVKDGLTLYGIMDETGVLKENEIFVITEEPPKGGRRVLVRDNIVITRSPAMHPGDIQIVNAVDVPDYSPLKELANVVVFSQHGSRDLPSMLSGGDLDGDLYNVIYDPRLVPEGVHAPADYPRVPAVELNREVTSKDMSDFFVTFMETDQLGSICNTHLQLADQSELGTLDEGCKTIAAMASTAVDFSKKTGVAVDMDNMPRAQPYKPDFMAHTPRVFISTSGELTVEDDDEQNYHNDEAFEDLDEERRPTRFYKSDKVLGQLYRAINEQQFLENMHHRHRALEKQEKEGGDVARTLLRYIKYWANQYNVEYEHQLDLARDIRASYESSIIDIAYVFEPSGHMPLTELEIFSGSILGRQGGAQGKPLRELAQNMRARFAAVVEYVITRIAKGEQFMSFASAAENADAPGSNTAAAAGIDEDMYQTYDEREFEAFPRAIACLQIAVVEPPVWEDRNLGTLKSFKYLAAETALREFRRWRITTAGLYSLPLEGLD